MACSCRTTSDRDDSDDVADDDEGTDERSDGIVDDAPSSTGGAPDDDDEAVLATLRAVRVKADAGDTNGALDEIERALRERPSSGLLHLERAQLGQHVGMDDAEVRRSLALALEALPENPRVHFAAAVYDEAQGHVDAAITGYQRTVTLRAEHGDAHLRLGRIHLARGEVGEARRSLDIAVSLMPTSIPAQLALADVAERVGDLPTAERAMLAIVNAHPTVPGHRQRLIAFYRRTGQAERERDAIRGLERIDPKDERKLRDLRRSKR